MSYEHWTAAIHHHGERKGEWYVFTYEDGELCLVADGIPDSKFVADILQSGVVPWYFDPKARMENVSAVAGVSHERRGSVFSVRFGHPDDLRLMRLADQRNEKVLDFIQRVVLEAVERGEQE